MLYLAAMHITISESCEPDPAAETEPATPISNKGHALANPEDLYHSEREKQLAKPGKEIPQPHSDELAAATNQPPPLRQLHSEPLTDNSLRKISELISAAELIAVVSIRSACQGEGQPAPGAEDAAGALPLPVSAM